MNILRVIRVAIAAIDSPGPVTALDFVVVALEEALPLVGDEALRPLLTEASKARADAIADAAAALKFGP